MTNREMQIRSMTFGFIGLGVGLLVGIGVLAHNASAQASAPKPGAVSPAARYQYMCLGNLDTRLYAPEVQQKLNELGAQGWRVLEAGTGSLEQYCFERRY